MQYKDYYQILGLKRGASQDEIKSAYRKLARKYHPDLKPGDKEAEKRFKEINEANAVLSKSDSRKKYDTLGSNWERVSQDQDFARQYYSPGRPGTGGQFDFGDMSDFFGTFFGGEDIASGIFGGGCGGARTRAQRGQDVEQSLAITLEESFHGTNRLFQMQIPSACPACGGQGMVMQQRQRGMVTSTPCPQCRGQGRTTSTRQIKVKIPRGVTNGSRIRLAGQGGPGASGGPAGDLFLIINLTSHDFFEILDRNLKCEIPVMAHEALLGTKVELKTLAGQVNLKIPAGTQSGTVLKLKNQGLPYPKGKKRGDLLAMIKITIPKNLTAKEKKLMEEFRKLREGKDKK